VTHRDMAADIDDLSRDYTEEIEAHRLTRERAEKAELERGAWERSAHAVADKHLETAEQYRVRAEKAEARVRELEAKLEGSAADDAFNAIAALCGCSSWDYPGQLVRDVARLKDLYECYSSGCEREQTRKEKAEARLAELVRRVREWSPLYSDHVAADKWRELDAILDKYEGGEHG
jgi:hypothetical protein